MILHTASQLVTMSFRDCRRGFPLHQLGSVWISETATPYADRCFHQPRFTATAGPPGAGRSRRSWDPQQMTLYWIAVRHRRRPAWLGSLQFRKFLRDNKLLNDGPELMEAGARPREGLRRTEDDRMLARYLVNHADPLTR